MNRVMSDGFAYIASTFSPSQSCFASVLDSHRKTCSEGPVVHLLWCLELVVGMVDANNTMAYIGKQFTSPSGLMRGPGTFKNPNKALTRFPAYELLPGGKTEVRADRAD